jgi:hypothetical protein
MKVTVENQPTYYVRWHYSGSVKKRRTECFIYKVEGDEKVIIATGHAKRMHDDGFQKDIGRKNSLTKALRNAGFDKPTRTEMWRTYKSTINTIMK